ncbi:unnamed protein product, partial [Ectocarpus sp. 13 AM-2016]
MAVPRSPTLAAGRHGVDDVPYHAASLPPDPAAVAVVVARPPETPGVNPETILTSRRRTRATVVSVPKRFVLLFPLFFKRRAHDSVVPLLSSAEPPAPTGPRRSREHGGDALVVGCVASTGPRGSCKHGGGVVVVFRRTASTGPGRSGKHGNGVPAVVGCTAPTGSRGSCKHGGGVLLVVV